MKYKIQITIDDKKLMAIVVAIISVSAIGLVVAYGTNNPQLVGHSWGEMICDSTLCANTTTSRVGIGTANPAFPLDVNGRGVFTSLNSGTSGGVAIRDAAGNPNAAYLQFVNNAYTAQYGFIQGLSTGGLNLGGGNVGIGTTTPAAKLDVAGDIRLGGSSFTSPGRMHIQSGENLYLNPWSGETTVGGGGGPGNLNVSGNLAVGGGGSFGNLNVAGNAQISGDLNVPNNGYGSISDVSVGANDGGAGFGATCPSGTYMAGISLGGNVLTLYCRGL